MQQPRRKGVGDHKIRRDHTIGAIGGRLALARALAGISARELDLLAGQPKGHASIIEGRPDAPAYTSTAVRYADALGLDLNWLLADRGVEPTHESTTAAVQNARAARTAPLRAA